MVKVYVKKAATRSAVIVGLLLPAGLYAHQVREEAKFNKPKTQCSAAHCRMGSSTGKFRLR